MKRRKLLHQRSWRVGPREGYHTELSASTWRNNNLIRGSYRRQERHTWSHFADHVNRLRILATGPHAIVFSDMPHVLSQILAQYLRRYHVYNHLVIHAYNIYYKDTYVQI